MAAAIARHLAGADATRIESAGTTAVAGAPATPEAREALHSLGVELGPHSARPLTPDLVAEADEILCMTDAHLRAVVDMDPGARGKTTMLSDRSINDPVGMPLEVYIDTARTLHALISRRMQEARL
jgi:protein-tyrosine phosphatase